MHQRHNHLTDSSNLISNKLRRHSLTSLHLLSPTPTTLDSVSKLCENSEEVMKCNDRKGIKKSYWREERGCKIVAKLRYKHTVLQKGSRPIDRQVLGRDCRRWRKGVLDVLTQGSAGLWPRAPEGSVDGCEEGLEAECSGLSRPPCQYLDRSQ